MDLTRAQPLFKVSWRSVHSNQGPDDRVEFLPVVVASMISYALNGGAFFVGRHDSDVPGKENRSEEGRLEEVRWEDGKRWEGEPLNK